MGELSQDIVKKIRNIQMTTTRLADDMMAGAWHSAFKGRGMEFEEVREYQNGDDIRTIDWNVSARMNHPYVKVFSEERELTVLLIVDVSASSNFGGKQQLKRDLIAEVGAVIAFSAIKNNDKIGLVLFSDQVEKYIPPKKGTRHVLRSIRELLAYQPQHTGTDLKKALEFVGKVQKKKAICFILSDFLCDIPENALNLIAKHHDLVAVSVTDPYEAELPKINLLELKDLETGISTTVDTNTLHIKRSDQLEAITKKIKAGLIHLSTDEPYLKALRHFFKQRGARH